MTSQIQLSFIKLEKALNALEAMVNKPMQDDRSNVDACIQRFEFTVELFWKLLKQILETKGEKAIYPKDVLIAAYKGDLIEDETVWLDMVYDRNLTSHTYNEELADKIYGHIKNYFPILKATFNSLANEYKE